MSAAPILARLEQVSKPFKTKAGTSHRACCPAHDDKSPSLIVTEKPDGVILMHCFGGCSTSEILDALEIDAANLFPNRSGGERKLVTGFKPTTGHAQRVLCAVAADVTMQAFLVASDPNFDVNREVNRALLIKAYTQLKSVETELRRAAYD